MLASFGFLFEYWQPLIFGALCTVGLSAAICAAAFPLSILLLCSLQSERKLLNYLAILFSKSIKALPVLVVLLWVYYVLPMILPLDLTPFSAALLAFTVNLTPFLADSLLSGVRAISPEQFEVARVMGISDKAAFFRIVFPQAARNTAPDMVSWFITELKLTSIASLIGLNELMHVGNTIISETYRPLEVYTTVGLLYLVVILSLERCFKSVLRIEYRRCL